MRVRGSAVRLDRHLVAVGGLILSLAATAPAQDGNPLGGPTDNPLAGPAEPVWVGGFANRTDLSEGQAVAGDMAVLLYRSNTSEGGFEGLMLLWKDAKAISQFAMRGQSTGERTVEGTFGEAGKAQFPFSAALEAEGVLVLSSGGRTYRLSRLPNSPRDSAELRRTAKDASGRAKTTPNTADGSHLAAGQKYHYTMTNPGAPPMTMVYEVKAVGDNLVRYDITTIMDMGQGPAPVGPPTSQEWKYEPGPAVDPSSQSPNVEVTRETVTVSGITFDCMVVKSGNTKTWVPAVGDRPIFPGLIKTQTDNRTTMELTRIEHSASTGASAAAERKVWVAESTQLEPHHFKRYPVSLSENATLSVRLSVRNNAPVSYYIMSASEGTLYQGGGRDTFFHVAEFYGEEVRNVNEVKCLVAGEYHVVVKSGAARADIELRVESGPGEGTALRSNELTLGNTDPGRSGPGRYQLFVVGFNVSGTAKGGKAWDTDGSGPDVFFQLAWGDGTGVSNFQRIGPERTYDNAWGKRGFSLDSPLAAWEFDWNGRGDVVLVAWDRDTLSHDFIAGGAVQSGSEPGSARALLRQDLGSFLGGRLGRNSANGDITLLLVWRRVR